MIIIGTFLCSFKIKRVGVNSVAIKMDETTCIKGICSIVIVLDHLGLQLLIPIILKPFTMVGYLCVSIFFFSVLVVWYRACWPFFIGVCFISLKMNLIVLLRIVGRAL